MGRSTVRSLSLQLRLNTQLRVSIVHSNHQAKNFLKSQMKRDHLCLFYASNTKVPGITGIARVVKEGYPDHNAWDPKHP